MLDIKYVAERIGKPLLGRADLIVEDAIAQGLSVHPDPDPHPRHANISGFPIDNRAKTLMMAVELAARATLHLMK